MGKDDFLTQVIELLVSKTLEDKLTWTVGSGVVRSQEVGKVRAEFRMATPNLGPVAGEWDRFVVFQQGQPIGQVFNGRKYASLQDTKEQQFVPLVDRLFYHLVIKPREQSLQESLDALSSL